MSDEKLPANSSHPKSVLHRSRVNIQSSLLQRSAVFFRRKVWLWPVVGAVLVSALGWVIYSAMERIMREQMADKLQVILKTDIKALDIWLQNQAHQTETLSKSLSGDFEKLTDAARQAPGKKQKVESALLDHPAQAQLRVRLSETLLKIGACGYVIADDTLTVLASSEDIMLGQKLPEGADREMLKEVLAGKKTFAPPHQFPLPMATADKNIRTGQPILWFASPFNMGASNGGGVLVLLFRPEADFTTILQFGRYGESGETYAFDANGLLLSQSRFDDDLQRIGLLTDRASKRSLMTVELRDPGVDMVEGGRPAVPRPQQPLTRMAAEGIQGRSGVDVVGYRDYRGVPVIGAWRWIKEYGLGVATEVNLEEAYKPLSILRLSFGVLLILLFVCAGVIFAFMLVVAKQSEKIHSAVLAAKQLGQYSLHEKLGEGGMGVVYKASHALLRRPTAVKVLMKAKASPESVVRFEREVQATARLNHPNTISIFDYGRTPEGDFYYAMEYLDGITLEQLVQQIGPLPDGRVVWILKQVCSSLAEAHGENLIHRDIKPANIILNRRGGVSDFVKVLDFGLVKPLGDAVEAGLTATDTLVGTPLYISPEALSNPEKVDNRSDLYAVGAVGYFLLTGGPVFDCMNVMEICMKHAKEKPVPVGQKAKRGVSSSVEAVIMRCLEKKQSARWQNASEMIAALDACTPAEPWRSADADAWWRANSQSKTPLNATVTQLTALAGPTTLGVRP